MPRLQNIGLVAILILACGTIFAAPARKQILKRASTPNPELAQARQKVKYSRPLAICYYIEDSRALRSIEDNAGQITVLAPQSFTLDAEGIVRGTVPTPLMDLARRKQLPVMPVVVNPRFDRDIASAVLRSPKLQERAASYLAYLARRENFVGWQLDLEHLDPLDKSRYSAFVRRVAAKLHRDGRLLSVAVTPRFSDNFPDAPVSGYRTGEWGASFDYRALGESADFIVLMAYDQHTSATEPGPVAGYDWVRTALDYAASRVPRHKLVLGIPFYGREWVVTPHGQISRSMTFESLSALLARPGIEVQWHERWRTPWVEYREEPDTHTVWFENGRSYEEKLSLAREYRLPGFAAWRLGTESPDFWRAAAEWAAREPSHAEPAAEKINSSPEGASASSN